MEELLTTEKISLRPARQADKKKVFGWLTQSNLTVEMLGPPNFHDNPSPTWDEFDNDYLDYYFNVSHQLTTNCI